MILGIDSLRLKKYWKKIIKSLSILYNKLSDKVKSIVTPILIVLALIFSIVGIAKRNASGKGKAIAGLILCILGVAAGIAIQTLFWSVVGNEAEKVYESIMDEYDAYDTSSNGNNNFYIDGDFVDTQNGYVTGNLHIDGYRVQF